MTVLIIFAIVALLAVSRSSPCKSGRALSRRFQRLGNMTGKSKSEIIEEVGAPSAVSYQVRGQLVQWQAPGYHIALRFDEQEMFAGIVHEFAR